jgi:hypothetical protein
VSVTPAMGARTVAGRISTEPIFSSDGTWTKDSDETLHATPLELSHCLRIELFYLFSADRQEDNRRHWRPEPMNRIREILLAEYIGALAIGLILAQAVMNLIATVVNNVMIYWEIEKSGSVLTGGQSFSWRGPITSLIDVALYLLAAFLMIRWLYLPKANETGTPVEDTRAAAE